MLSSRPARYPDAQACAKAPPCRPLASANVAGAPSGSRSRQKFSRLHPVAARLMVCDAGGAVSVTQSYHAHTLLSTCRPGSTVGRPGPPVAPAASVSDRRAPPRGKETPKRGPQRMQNHKYPLPSSVPTGANPAMPIIPTTRLLWPAPSSPGALLRIGTEALRSR